MTRKLLSLLLLAALCRGSVAHAADGWAQLKAGMSLEKTVATVGAPLIKSRGRGYDLWIYDGGAEVIAAQGAVIAWTAPAAAKPSILRAPAVAQRTPVVSLPLKAAVAQSDGLPAATLSAVRAKTT